MPADRWSLDLSCLYCGGPLRHLNGTSNGLLAQTVVCCDPCSRQYLLTTRMAPMAWQQREADERSKARRLQAVS